MNVSYCLAAWQTYKGAHSRVSGITLRSSTHQAQPLHSVCHRIRRSIVRLALSLLAKPLIWYWPVHWSKCVKKVSKVRKVSKTEVDFTLRYLGYMNKAYSCHRVCTPQIEAPFPFSASFFQLRDAWNCFSGRYIPTLGAAINLMRLPFTVIHCDSESTEFPASNLHDVSPHNPGETHSSVGRERKSCRLG